MAQSPSSSISLRVDHASVCGADLDTMRQDFARVGLTADYGGPHANGVTHMALLGFEDGSYLELIAPQKPGVVEGSGWSTLMAGNAGPCAWAVGTNDIKQEIERLKGLGIAVSEAKPGSRKRPDGMAVEWMTADVGSSTPGATLPFIIQDRTPHNWRVQPSPSIKDSGLVGIDAVVLAVNDLDKSAALFQRAYGWPPPVTEDHFDFDAKLAWFPGQPVILAMPRNGRSWLVDRLHKFGETPIGYVLGTQNFDKAAKRFHISYHITWFGQKFAWFDSKKLHGARIAIWGD
ncbi:MAG TPA: VOC family protein [Terriglobales bacterium]|nr:VOC family protein [Terriglobales bacterium]